MENYSQPERRCLLFVIDALSHRVLSEQFADEKLNNMRRMVEGGGEMRRCISIFPSITPAATCSIATGCYPSRHAIEGACWFDRETDEIAYYGDDLMFTLERGLSDFFVDFADRLNFERLAAPTIFEMLEDEDLETACVNYMWFAGQHEHKRRTPWLLRIIAGKLGDKVRGPKFLKLGEFVETLPLNVKEPASQGILSKFGFNDSCTAETLLAMAEGRALPTLTLGYFPNNDFRSHEVGIHQSGNTVLADFDRFLGDFVKAIGGWDCLGSDYDIVIVGDHSQTEYGDEGPRTLLLDKALQQFQQSRPGTGWQSDDQIFICPNMRAAAIYLRDRHNLPLQERIIERILSEPEVDQVIWEDEAGARNVKTSDRGHLVVQRADKEAGSSGWSQVHDEFGTRWSFRGNLDSIDARMGQDSVLEYGKYPNAIERIDGSFVPGSKPIWVTARGGCEFRIYETGSHLGGSHGSLSMEDSESALLVSRGVDLKKLSHPSESRIVDVVSVCLQIVGSGVKNNILLS